MCVVNGLKGGDCLIHAGKKYKLKTESLEVRRARLGTLPEWDPIWDDHPELLQGVYAKTVPKVQ